jgi:hypothetical protein
MKRIGIILGVGILLVVVLFGWWIISRPERGTTGSVSTRFRWLGPNDKIVIDSFDDPKVQGVACYIARAQTGGVKGGLGVAEDTSDASISCRQVARSRSSASSRTARAFSTNTAASCSKSFRSCAFSTVSAMCWFTWPTATGLLRAARRTVSARCRSWGGRRHRFELLGLTGGKSFGAEDRRGGRDWPEWGGS